jgi:hypothetical protein
VFSLSFVFFNVANGLGLGANSNVSIFSHVLSGVVEASVLKVGYHA